MTPKKSTPKIEKISTKDYDLAIQLRERYMDYALMDALAGDFRLDLDTALVVAFSMTDNPALVALCDERERKVSFREAPDVLAKAKQPKTKEGKPRDFTLGERHDLMTKTKGTRLFAYGLWESQQISPFD